MSETPNLDFIDQLPRSAVNVIVPSKTPTASSPPSAVLKTAQDLYDWVDASPSLDVYQKRNRKSAIMWLGRIDHTPLAAVPLDVKFIVNDRIAKIRKRKDLTKKRRGAIVSLLNAVLISAGLLKVGTRRRGDLTHEWNELVTSVKELDHRKALGVFGRFCSGRAVEPAAVSDDVWKAFIDETFCHSTVKNPRDTVLAVARVSNRARYAFPDWPLPELEPPRNPRQFSIPKQDLPDTFWAEIADYMEKSASKPPRRFMVDWPSRLKPSTLQRQRDQLWRTASAQVRAGRPPGQIISLAALFDRHWLEEAMNHFYDHAGGMWLRDHLNIAGVWLSIGKRWLRLSQPELDWLKKDVFEYILEELGPADFSLKNKQKLDQFDNPETVQEFLLLPYTIWADIKKKKQLTAADAVEMMAAAAIEILLVTMIRRQNVADIDLNKHFWPAQPVNGKWTLHFDSPQVKNAQTLDHKLPPSTVALLRYYVEKCRPLLLKHPTGMLFLREDGTPKGGVMMYHLIKSRIRKHLDLDVNVHLFRHIGTMLYLDKHPGGFETCRIMLGHRSILTTQKFYAFLRTTKAIEQFTNAVLGGRDEAVKKLKLKI